MKIKTKAIVGSIFTGIFVGGIFGLILVFAFEPKPSNLVFLVVGSMVVVFFLKIYGSYKSTKCPSCKTAWAGEETGNYDVLSSNTIWKKNGDSRTQYLRQVRKYEYQCRECGNTYYRTKTEDERIG